MDTYYVYDDFGDLCFVIPPGFPTTTTTITENDATFNELIYAYKYDGRRRLIEKKIPGKGWEWIVYNENDQIVLTQDAIQRSKTIKEWSYTKYDAFGRVIETGLYSDATLITQAIAQNTVNAVTQYWETRGQNSTYSNVAFPTITTTAKKPLVINYYDDYTFDGGTTASLQAVGITKSTKTKTLLTGTKVCKDDGTAPLLTINYYDDRARLIQSASQNHLGGTDYVTNTYNFVGEVLTSKREHKASAGGAVTTLLTSNTYDHVGRLKDSKHKVNAQSEVILARNEYNEIGQLKEKKQHSENSGTNFINTTTYSYNERGWTTEATSPHFTYQLNYNTGSSPQYNGNIAQQLWRHGSTNTPNVYSYSYDKLNRLLNGTSTGTVMSEVLTYDDMGNIKTLKRDNGTTTTYNYTVNSVASNRLQSLTGGLTGTYTYDANGNATKDRTDMTFVYNHLNLPKSATKSGTTVTYLYDAAGTKLRKTAVVGATTTVRDYVGGIEYNKVGTGAQTIEMIHMPEGYLQPNGSTYTYYYNLTDHLGNVRATLQRTSATAGTVIQKHDYYPFGKSKALLASGINKYLYKGKEVQSELGDQQDYGARFYDAEIGRWNVVDPLAERFETVSPYNYAINNPILMVDPNGMAADTAKVAWYSQLAEVVVTAMSNISDFSRLWEIHKTADMYSRRSDGSRDHAGYAGMTLMLDKATGGMGDLMGARAVAWPSSLSRIFKPSKINNLIPKRLARIVPADVNSNTLGAPGAQDVFVTAADDIAGLNASQIADKLTIPKSKSGFLVIEFDTPSVGLSSPINRTNPGFVGFGKTAGGAREFTIPNQVIPAGQLKKL